jgi:DNA polymerase-3 subunit epsilon
LSIDTETTGLNPRKDRIVSLAVAKREPGAQTVSMREWMVNPGMSLPEEATAVHGIMDAMVADKPSLVEVGSEFLRIVEKADVLVGYMWSFDDMMLLAGLGDAWEDAIAGKPVIDVLVVVRFDEVGRYWKGKGRHKLACAAEHLGVKLPSVLQPHQASADAFMSASMLGKLFDFLPDDADEAAALIKQQRVVQEEAFQAWRAKQPPLDAGDPAGKGGPAEERG